VDMPVILSEPQSLVFETEMQSINQHLFFINFFQGTVSL